jgi:FdhD protein
MEMDIFRYPTIRVNNGEISEINDNISVEEPFRIYLNDEFVEELTASPSQLEELGAGHVICEGLARSLYEVNVSGNSIIIYGEPRGKIKIPPPRYVTIEKEDVFDVMNSTKSEIWEKTEGVHCAVLFSDGKLVADSKDIGRHNTVDKVVGLAVLNKIDVSYCILGCTGRQPAAMVSKAANARIPIVISKSATTDKGIHTADQAGVTLVCFARENRFTVYTHPDRILI